MEQDPRYFQERGHEELAPIIGIGKWIVTMLLMYIPIVNLVLLIVWAVSDKENPNRKNYAIAMLIMIVISTILMAIVFSQFMAALSSFTGGLM